ncbi:MAG TPA: hypothetical protein VHM24_06615 [Gemmatimonadaceae bacterium]|nr:hypothetical protein [Gemmatimonadaceae bacterium]
MSSRRATRLLAATFVAWFTLASGESAPLSPCVMHPGAAMLMHASDVTPPHQAHGGGAPSRHSNGSDHADCSCLGQCMPQAIAFVTPRLEIAFARPPLFRALPVYSIAAERLPVAAPFLVPFANGPPALT